MSFANFKANGVSGSLPNSDTQQSRPEISEPAEREISAGTDDLGDDLGVDLGDDLGQGQTLLDAVARLDPRRNAPSEPAQRAAIAREEKNRQAIKVIMMRLSDLLFMGSDNVSPQERALADDLLSRLFDRACRETKFKLIERMLQHTEPPAALIRTMLHCEDEIALPLLRSPMRLKQADLISVVITSGTHYQRAVAERSVLQSAVCDTLIQCADVSTIRVMLRNASAVISRAGFVRLAEKSLKDHDVLEPLIERLDFPADLAHLVFWWSPSHLRRKIIERFASPRQMVFEVVPQDMTADFADLLPEVSNALRMVRKAQKVDKTVTDRALEELEFGDANLALDAFAEAAHLRAETIAQILDDRGGEAIGVFCKAIGFGKIRFFRLREILAKRKGIPWDAAKARDDAVSVVHDTLSTDKADLILRYWDRATREIEI